MANFLNDRSFLLQVNRHKVKKYYAAFLCLDFQTEKPLARLEGKVVSGNLAIAANTPTRRTATLSVIFDNQTYNIAEITNLIAIDKKISVSIGIENPFYHLPQYQEYGDILWFKQGVFVITKASSSVSTSSMTVSVNLSDKMAFLDGTCGGTLQASTSFHDKIIIDAEENVTTEYPLIKDIIFEAVHHFGGEDPSRIIIEDVPSVGRVLQKYVGKEPINFSTVDDDNSPLGWTRSSGTSFVLGTPPIENFLDSYVNGDNVGYKETPLTYPGELIMKGGSNVVQVLDEIVKTLGNFEYFYDVEGNFHFKQKNNFMATGHTPLNLTENDDNALQSLYCPRYSPTLLVNEFANDELVTQVSFSPNYGNIKNDFVYWGSRQGSDNVERLVRYHLAIDERPYDIPEPVTAEEKFAIGDNWSLCHKSIQEVRSEFDDTIIRYGLVGEPLNTNEKPGDLIAPSLDKTFPNNPDCWFNWREELYRKALMAYGSSTRGSYYDEELMAEWRNIYDPTSTIANKGMESFEQKWVDKYGSDNPAMPWVGYCVQAVNNPEELRYWLDIIDVNSNIGKYSVQRIGRRQIVTEDSKVNEVYAKEVNDLIFIDAPTDLEEWKKTMQKVKEEYIPIGQSYCFVQQAQWSYFQNKNSFGTCYEGCRQQLYEHLILNSSITLTAIPIFYLDVNQCIRLNFPDRGIIGDYVINNISFNLSQAPTMTLQLQEALVVV